MGVHCFKMCRTMSAQNVQCIKGKGVLLKFFALIIAINPKLVIDSTLKCNECYLCSHANIIEVNNPFEKMSYDK